MEAAISADSNVPDDRRSWLSVFAKAEEQHLEQSWNALSEKAEYVLTRQPEVGTVMVRGRVGGTGPAFNVGETTITRCSAQLSNGTHGFGYVIGRKPRHAELIAVFDALMQDQSWRGRHGAALLEPLIEKQRNSAHAVRAKSEKTRVEFFTLSRGDG